jgi:hypothetical protein
MRREVVGVGDAPHIFDADDQRIDTCRGRGGRLAGVLGCEQADIATTALQTKTADLPAKA